MVMRNNVLFAVFIVVILVFLFSISGKKYPQIPADSAHQQITDAGQCLTCHGSDGKHPRKPSHPPKDECTKCHKKKRLKPSR
jgi:cytochrome c553